MLLLPSLSRGHTGASTPAVALLAIALLVACPTRPASAQVTRTLTSCTPDALAICTELRLTADLNLFEIGIRAIGATGQPSLPTSVYNLVFGTGSAAAASPLTTSVVPVAIGGAMLSDASPWEVFDAGDALFLSALTNFGVGGCAGGAAIDGFGQAALTCGSEQYVAFRFIPSAVFNPALFTILNLEAVGLTPGLPAASCGAGGESGACIITADVLTGNPPGTTVPEPATVLLLGAGLFVLIGMARRRASLRTRES